jgi:hypothetical protein
LKKLFGMVHIILVVIKNLFRSMGAIAKFDHFSRQQWLDYLDRSCREPASQIEKLRLLKSFSQPSHFWIETGTYMGYTTKGLSEVAFQVFSLEPSPIYYQMATEKLLYAKNVKIVNQSSETGLSGVLELIPDGSHVNFWLDGHYSAGNTYLGENHCPVKQELEVIEPRLKSLTVQIFIDDFRLFGKETGYPTKDFLVDWSRQHGFDWTVERDIFILSKVSSE